ncbi:Arf-GAP with coiled-coil, ANK repeat and PH domain-containing protein 2 [Collichthys lucidus]|uniref:Arf-GAP with coiled-coil, ANK repeat and PH domain-containing protein 2 n=1 Tax=Collichthys lucidus TaxID=240159 RepID=A0A4U5UJ42_COLLU|nr:Arf-GAP with coiled-coil, ANK repeat and PH domain-containing protein 2 [Collichthys lucidus]
MVQKLLLAVDAFKGQQQDALAAIIRGAEYSLKYELQVTERSSRHQPAVLFISASIQLMNNGTDERYSVMRDETYQDIFQDFTHMASNDPDKLNRYQQYDPQRP